ncbi:MAG TPA: DUF4251 domain-containing protein [Puia sp.]|jgi:hypothetical protein
MKILPNVLKKTIPLLLIAAALPFLAPAQSSKADKKAAQQAAIKQLVESQHYDFKAQTAMPMRGPTRQLTSDYDLKVTKEAIVSYLPYFGQAYTAPIDPSKGGIQFTSKDFNYTITNGKKGGWDIRIKPKDYRDVQQLSLSISEDGYATLQVTSTSRQPISFYGMIAAIRQPKQK